MIVRLRSRDGLERIEVDNSGTVGALKLAIRKKLDIPIENITLSTKQQLLTSKEPAGFTDMADSAARLSAVGVSHGSMVFMFYDFERSVEPIGKVDTRAFGPHMTMQDIIAKQVRIERQDASHAASLSFDRDAANVFQTYVQGALAFSIKRGGILYGRVDEAKNVLVEAVYEPPQEGSASHLTMHRKGAEQQQVEMVAGLLGLTKVGWIFSQSTQERDFICSTEEICQMAAMQEEVGEHCVTVLVSWDTSAEDGSGQVHFEAFQCSDQCTRLHRDGWLLPQEEEAQPGAAWEMGGTGQRLSGGAGSSKKAAVEEGEKKVEAPPAKPTGVSRVRNPLEPDNKAPVIVAGKDVGEVDNDYFLLPLKILDHAGFFLTSFPVENRLLPQGKTELRQHLERHKGKRYVERITDFHLLLWLARQPHLDANDMLLLCQAVRGQTPLMDYHLIIDSIAGIS